jgi:hypothetical protein
VIFNNLKYLFLSFSAPLAFFSILINPSDHNSVRQLLTFADGRSLYSVTAVSNILLLTLLCDKSATISRIFQVVDLSHFCNL